MPSSQFCPCGSGIPFEQCCAPVLSGDSLAVTAQQLMRSRYSAYTLQNEPYLLQTWHSSTRPSQLNLAIEPVKWLGLKIITTQAGQAADSTGTVEFVARYKVNGKAHRLAEKSRFVKEQGRWFYLDGDIK